MNAEYLVDTSVLVTAYDRSKKLKQEMAFELLDQLAQDGNAAVSTQVLAEFIIITTRKMPAPLTEAEALNSLENYLRAWKVLEVTSLVILEAARGARDHQFKFNEAQIWATARLNQIPVVLSEDFNSGMVVEGVRFVDPFAAYFNLRE
jgi:predicted nucleic acid-binding protein